MGLLVKYLIFLCLFVLGMMPTRMEAKKVRYCQKHHFTVDYKSPRHLVFSQESLDKLKTFVEKYKTTAKPTQININTIYKTSDMSSLSRRVYRKRDKILRKLLLRYGYQGVISRKQHVITHISHRNKNNLSTNRASIVTIVPCYRMAKVVGTKKRVRRRLAHAPVMAKKAEEEGDQHFFHVSLNNFHAELASEQVGTGLKVDEILSEVRLSGDIKHFYKVSQQWYVGGFLGLKWYEFSNKLSTHIVQDQSRVSLGVGVVAHQHMLDWLTHEFILKWYQQIYYTGQSVLGNIVWNFDLANVFRLEYRPIFYPVQKDSWDWSLSPVLGVFTGSSSRTLRGYAIGAETIVHFLFSKRLGLRARYAFSNFSYKDGLEWKLKQENLELGVHYRFQF